MKKLYSIFILTFLAQSLSAQYKSALDYSNQSIFDIVNIKEENIDIGLWALIIAKEYDNSVDVQKYLKKLDSMSTEIKIMLVDREKDMDKFLATKMFLYEPGKWNNYKPFSYDLEDPLGHILEHQLLSNYIDSRKGNCVSMPTLFLALMERVDPTVPFVGVKAPLHLFCRLEDRQTGDSWNVETTNGGNPARNQWYIDEMNISQTAINSGLYLKDLTKKEYIAELIGPLIHKYRRDGKFEKALKYTDLLLKLSPESDVGLVQKGALLDEIGYQKLKEETLTEKEKKYYHDEAEKYINKAFALGWKPESKEERKEYLKSVKTKLQKTKSEGK